MRKLGPVLRPGGSIVQDTNFFTEILQFLNYIIIKFFDEKTTVFLMLYFHETIIIGFIIHVNFKN